MNGKLILALGIATLAMVLAVLTARYGADDASKREERVFPELEANLSSLTSVVVQSVNGSVTLQRETGGWVIAERAGYPADFEKLSELLRGMATARFVEQKTARSENHVLLGVGDLTDETSEAVLVELTGGSDRYALLFGHESESGQGTFVRAPADDQVWLISPVAKPAATASDWIRAVVLNVDTERVTSVRHVNTAGELFVSRDEETDNFVVQGLPEGAELQYATVANALSRALVNLRITDVRPRIEGEGAAKAVAATTATFSLDDGTTIVVSSPDAPARADESWLRISVMPAEDATAEFDQALLDKFEFKVAQYTFEQFAKSMADMIKPEDEAAEGSPDV